MARAYSIVQEKQLKIYQNIRLQKKIYLVLKPANFFDMLTGMDNNRTDRITIASHSSVSGCLYYVFLYCGIPLFHRLSETSKFIYSD